MSSLFGARRARNETPTQKQRAKVTQDVEKLAFNTAISALMVLANALGGSGPIPPAAPRIDSHDAAGVVVRRAACDAHSE